MLRPGTSGPTSAAPDGVACGAVLVAVLATVVGLSLGADGSSLVGQHLAWSVTAATGALLQLCALYGAAYRAQRQVIWQLQTAGLLGVGLAWLAVALPGIAADSSCLLTIGLAAALVACARSQNRSALLDLAALGRAVDQHVRAPSSSPVSLSSGDFGPLSGPKSPELRMAGRITRERRPSPAR